MIDAIEESRKGRALIDVFPKNNGVTRHSSRVAQLSVAQQKRVKHCECLGGKSCSVFDRRFRILLALRDDSRRSLLPKWPGAPLRPFRDLSS